MVKNHIKRINAPKRWDILRKETKFISRPNAGRDFSLSLALNTVLKEMLGKTKTTKESKFLIRYKSVLVNGVRRYDEKFPVGFLDVITFPELKENYRLLVNDKNKLFAMRIPETEAGLKLSKVSDKKELKGGIYQFNCSDGRNFLMKKGESKAAEIKSNDTILYTMPDQKIKESLKLEKGALVFLYQGKHIGHLVKVEDFKESNIVFSLQGEKMETKRKYAFVVGKDKSVISLPDSMKEQKRKA
jgi:small subunit ribosomal protein S4e